MVQQAKRTITLPAFAVATFLPAVMAAGVLCAGTATVRPRQHPSDVSHIYRLTGWLENALFDGAWWINPALPATLDEALITTVNVSPLRDRYTLSSLRLLLPLTQPATLGLGILGAGPDQTGQFASDGSGATYSSRFRFTRPSLQTGASVRTRYGLSAGILLSAGFESIQVTADENALYPLVAWSTGLLVSATGSPLLAGGSWSRTVHFQPVTFVEQDIRIVGMLSLADTLVSIASHFTLSSAPSASRSPLVFDPVVYALNTQLRLRIRHPLGISLGVSSDFLDRRYIHRMGTSLHGGVEILRSNAYPFYGGYEVAVLLASQRHIFHRFWFGYRLAKPAWLGTDPEKGATHAPSGTAQ